MSGVVVGHGKATLSKHGLLWGKMLDPSFVPAMNSDLVQSHSVKPVEPKPKPTSRPTAASTAAPKPVIPPETIVNASKPRENSEQASVTIRKRAESVENVAPASLPPCTVSSALTTTQQTIHDWIRGDLGVETCPIVRKGQTGWLPKAPIFTAHTAVELFRDGVFLCELVAVLEAKAGNRATITAPDGKLSLPGVSFRPNSTAAALRNTNIALERLREQRHMPATYLWAAEDLVSGSPEPCWGLLTDVWKCFRRRTRSRSAPRCGPKAKEPAPSKADEAERQAGPPSLPMPPPPPPLPPAEPAKENIETAPKVSHASRPRRKERRIEPLPESCQPPSFDPVSEAQKVELREWLHKLGVCPSRHSERAHVLDNPFSNGTLMCDVIAVLAPDTFRDVLHVPDSSFPQSKRVVYRNPRTLHQARSNLELVIDVLEAEAKLRSMTHSGDVGDLLLPLMYLWNGEEVVKGHMDAAWGLLAHLKSAFPEPSSVHIITHHHSQSSSLGSESGYHSYTRLGYSLADRIRLEQSLLSWLYSIGALPSSSESGDLVPGVPQTLEAIDDVCRDGTLLCNLVHVIGGPTVKGVFWKPSSDKLAVANVSKACSSLRALKGFSPRFLDCAEEIVRGDREALLGLLEDCHRYFDRQPPLPFLFPAAETKSRTPYFGKHIPPQNLLHQKPSSAPKEQHLNLSKPPDHDPTDLLPLPYSSSSQNLRSDDPHAAYAAAMSFVSPFGVDSDLYVLDVAPPPPPPQVSEKPFLTSVPNSESLDGFSFPDPTCDAAVVTSWLADFGIHLKRPWELLGSRALEFSDGLVFCRLLEVMTAVKGGMQGIERKPRTAAQKLHNVRKAMEALRDVPAMPTDFLYEEVAVRDADTSIIIPLLLQIRKTFAHVKPTISRPK